MAFFIGCVGLGMLIGSVFTLAVIGAQDAVGICAAVGSALCVIAAISSRSRKGVS